MVKGQEESLRKNTREGAETAAILLFLLTFRVSHFNSKLKLKDFSGESRLSTTSLCSPGSSLRTPPHASPRTPYLTLLLTRHGDLGRNHL